MSSELSSFVRLRQKLWKTSPLHVQRLPACAGTEQGARRDRAQCGIRFLCWHDNNGSVEWWLRCILPHTEDFLGVWSHNLMNKIIIFGWIHGRFNADSTTCFWLLFMYESIILLSMIGTYFSNLWSAKYTYNFFLAFSICAEKLIIYPTANLP